MHGRCLYLPQTCNFPVALAFRKLKKLRVFRSHLLADPMAPASSSPHCIRLAGRRRCLLLAEVARHLQLGASRQAREPWSSSMGGSVQLPP